MIRTTSPPPSAFARFDAANVADAMWTNALVPTELVSRLLPILAPDAVVLNVSSWLSSVGGKTGGGHYGYAGSKALLNMFTRAMALEFADETAGADGGPRRAVVAFNPGWMRTDMGGARAGHGPQGCRQLHPYHCRRRHTRRRKRSVPQCRWNRARMVGVSGCSWTEGSDRRYRMGMAHRDRFRRSGRITRPHVPSSSRASRSSNRR